MPQANHPTTATLIRLVGMADLASIPPSRLLWPILMADCIKHPSTLSQTGRHWIPRTCKGSLEVSILPTDSESFHAKGPPGCANRSRVCMNTRRYTRILLLCYVDGWPDVQLNRAYLSLTCSSFLHLLYFRYQRSRVGLILQLSLFVPPSFSFLVEVGLLFSCFLASTQSFIH